MDEKLDLLLARVEEVCDRVDKLTRENTELRAEVESLRDKLGRASKDHEQYRLATVDKDETVKRRLQVILRRLNQLEGNETQVFT